MRVTSKMSGRLYGRCLVFSPYTNHRRLRTDQDLIIGIIWSETEMSAITGSQYSLAEHNSFIIPSIVVKVVGQPLPHSRPLVEMRFFRIVQFVPPQWRVKLRYFADRRGNRSFWEINDLLLVSSDRSNRWLSQLDNDRYHSNCLVCSKISQVLVMKKIMFFSCTVGIVLFMTNCILCVEHCTQYRGRYIPPWFTIHQD